MIFVSYYIFVYYLRESAITVDSLFCFNEIIFYIFYLDKYYRTKINYKII